MWTFSGVAAESSLEWDAFAAKSEGVLHAGVVDCSKSAALCKTEKGESTGWSTLPSRQEA